MSLKSFQQLQQDLGEYRPNKKWYRQLVKRSAVAIILREAEQGIECLMIKRAQREGDPWSGHMGFPGGRAEPEDKHNLQTARRETLEEIGLDTKKHARYLGRLSDLNARAQRKLKAMVVSSYVFLLERDVALSLNDEVDEVVWVPLNFLADHNNREQMFFKREKLELQLPCYHYQGRHIWGMSLRMLDELLALLKY